MSDQIKEINNNLLAWNKRFNGRFFRREFENLYTYQGVLGAIYTKECTQFVIWAPTASEVELILYGKNGNVTNKSDVLKIKMIKAKKGIWQWTQSGDLADTYYNYLVTVDGKTNEVVDPYAKAVGVNGKCGMVVDLAATNPEGWEDDKRPQLNAVTDAMIYEMHIRDFTIELDYGKEHYNGKYEGIWRESAMPSNANIKTGMAHLLELGVNTVQIMPTFDYDSVDETKLDVPQFNWGYDPQNYNVPEGSYATDPYDGSVRISQFKQLIYEMHQKGIKVIMDVVYNHTSKVIDSNLNLAVPGYYYRSNPNGTFSNGSGCGNETASERTMVNKFIVDSVTYWAEEYHIDGFRFDLMGVHDQNTMLTIREALDKIDDSIIILGEGWTGGPSALSKEKQSLKKYISKAFGNKQIAAFSDDMRDGLRGHVFTPEEAGFLQGEAGFEETIKFAIVAATAHAQIDYSKVKGSSKPWAMQPYQTITYASCHDNFTLWDKLKTTRPLASKEELLAMNKIAAAVVYTSQGIPFMLSGEEFARTKVNEDGTLNENSYHASDKVNAIGWQRKFENIKLYEYYKGLIQLRSNHPVFRLNTSAQIQKSLKFMAVNKANVIAYTLTCEPEIKEPWQQIVVAFNTNKEAVEVTLPYQNWVIVVNKEKAGIHKLEEINNGKLILPAQSACVAVDKASFK